MTKLTAEIVQRAKRETIDWLRGNPSEYFKVAFPAASYDYTFAACFSDRRAYCAGAMLGAFLNHLVGRQFSNAEGVGKTIYGDFNTFYDFAFKGIDTRCPREAADYLERLVELPEYRINFFDLPSEEEQLQEFAEKLGYELVKKTTPDTFSNWDALDPRFKYIARDQDGTVYAYTCEPSMWNDHWDTMDAESRRVDTVFTGHTPGTCDWSESLITRPN